MTTEQAHERGTRGHAPPEARIDSAHESDAIIAASRISARLWRLYAYFWLVCLLFPILALTQTRLAPVQLLIALAGMVVFVASYFWVMWPHLLKRALPARAQTRTALLLVMLTALVLVLSLVYGNAFLWLFVGVSAIAGVTLRARRAFEIVVVLTLLTVAMGVGMSGGVAQTDWLHLIPLVLLVRGLGVDMIGLALLADALRDLHAARRELARMAVMEERLRLARDLHDLLGHSLSLITLKSWTVREGVTNVIRHSRARQCRIQVSCANGSARAEVANNGEREQGQEGMHSRRGSGLAGLAERVQAHGGHLEAGPQLTDGTWSFRLSVELPIRSSAPAIEERQP